jgi:hypothetical protein
VSQQLTIEPVLTNTPSPLEPDIRNNITLTKETTPEEPTVTSSSTITQTPTLSPEDPRKSLGAPDWKEDFNKDNRNFYHNEDEHSNFFYDSGNLVLIAKNPEQWMAWSLSYPKPKDFYLEAAVSTEKCSGMDQYGLVFRAPDLNNGYFFGFTCDGKFSLRDHNVPGYLIPWTENSAIKAGSNQSNRIGVLALGDRYAFYANGQLLQETKDITFTNAGLFGAFVSSANTANFTVKVDEVSYWNK